MKAALLQLTSSDDPVANLQTTQQNNHRVVEIATAAYVNVPDFIFHTRNKVDALCMQFKMQQAENAAENQQNLSHLIIQDLICSLIMP